MVLVQRKTTNISWTIEEDVVRFVKETWLDTNERIKITDSNHDHDKSSRSSNSGNGHSNISDDESHKFIGKILIIKLVGMFLLCQVKMF